MAHIWSSDVNNSSSFDFRAELNKEMQASDVMQDYITYAKKMSIVPCPMFTTYRREESSVSRIILNNCRIDLASWRAMLLALNSTGSTITELCTCNVQLSYQHMLDLSVLLERGGPLTTLKLDYLAVEGSGEQVAAAYKSLLALSSGTVSYISFKSNALDDSFIINNRVEIINHLCLTALNLSENHFTDAGSHNLLRMLALTPALRYVSLKRNHLSGQCLVALPSAVEGCTTGTALTAEEDLEFKNLIKNITERNKQLKEVNKKRKKDKLPELEEFLVPSARLVKSEGGELLLLNANRISVDLAGNDISPEYILEMLQLISARSSSICIEPLLSLKVRTQQNSDLVSILTQFETKGVIKFID